MKDAQDAANAVASLRYPPRGVRGFGPFIAQSRWGTSLPRYQAKIEDELICCLLIETPQAIANLDDICAVEGIDLMVLAGFDLSTTMGISGQFDHPEYVAAVTRFEEVCTKAGLPMSGVGLQHSQVTAQRDKGYRMIAGFDVLWLRAKADELTSWTT
ncbi:aldolase/citrate lyase family protein [Sulfitobacter aestuariivivens]|uniref:aldolase/citrate lyase family protein n=1 Tax=Sulfitobacter aestuariivivens TaxID=2766981 RepID=UPI00360AD08E